MTHYQIIELVDSLKHSWVVKGFLTAISMVWLHLFGAWNIAFSSLLTLLLLDFIAKMLKVSFNNGGFIEAIKRGKIRSKIFRDKTMYKIVRYLITLAAGNQIANILAATIAANAFTIYGVCIITIVRMFFISYICICEVISIIETLIGVDGDDLKPVANYMEDTRTRLFDRILDRLMDQLIKKLDISNKEDK